MPIYRFFLFSYVLIFFVTPLSCMVHNDSVNFATAQLFNCALTGEDSDLIDTFISHGGNIFATNILGQTPLDIALQQQDYWNKKIKSGSHIKKVKKHSNNFVCVVKKLRYAEQKAKRTLTTKPYEPFNCLCTYATIEQKRLLHDEEAQKTFLLTQKNRLQAAKKITLAQRLLKKRCLNDFHHSSSTKTRDDETEVLDIETDSQDGCAQTYREKHPDKAVCSKPLKQRIKLTVLIPEKPITALPLLQVH